VGVALSIENSKGGGRHGDWAASCMRSLAPNRAVGSSNRNNGRKGRGPQIAAGKTRSSQADLRRVFAPTISAVPPDGGVHPPRAFLSRDRAPNQGARPMLSEIFILRLEALLRASNEPSPASIATRFVPIKPPASPIKHLQPAGNLVRGKPGRPPTSRPGLRWPESLLG
jgi:hypothetical protein